MIHGISPSQVRDGNVSLKAFPPLVFQMTVRGTQEMNYRIEKKGCDMKQLDQFI